EPAATARLAATAEPPRGRPGFATGLLAALGLVQIGAAALGLEQVRGLAMAWNASPEPKVFTTVRGHEALSTRFFVEWTDARGGARSVPITAERYAGLEGPYNRRNVYGAVIAFGPV